MSEHGTMKPLPKLPSERMKVLSAAVRAGEPARCSRSAQLVWLALAVGWAGEDGRCWPQRDKLEASVKLGRSAVTTAITELVRAGWLERLGRPKPGRTSELRVMVPMRNWGRVDGPERGRENGPEYRQLGRVDGRMGPRIRSNGAGEPAPEQDTGTESQQQQADDAAAGGPVEGKKPPAAVEHPTVTKVLDAARIIEAGARASIAGVDGIEMVIGELWKSAKRADNPAGLLIRKAETEAPALIQKRRERLSTRGAAGPGDVGPAAAWTWPEGMDEVEREAWWERVRHGMGQGDRARPELVEMQAACKAGRASASCRSEVRAEAERAAVAQRDAGGPEADAGGLGR